MLWILAPFLSVLNFSKISVIFFLENIGTFKPCEWYYTIVQLDFSHSSYFNVTLYLFI